jgi:hypothetical protein
MKGSEAGRRAGREVCPRSTMADAVQSAKNWGVLLEIKTGLEEEEDLNTTQRNLALTQDGKEK